jgi:hypothetical protein
VEKNEMQIGGEDLEFLLMNMALKKRSSTPIQNQLSRSSPPVQKHLSMPFQLGMGLTYFNLELTK